MTNIWMMPILPTCRRYALYTEKDTGALRAGIHKHLKRLKYVKEFHLGGFGEGDAGVTIVVFK